MKRYKFILMAVLASAGLIGCSNEDDVVETPEPQTANLSVELIDAPGDYEEVFVEVEDVMVRIDSEEEDAVEGWQSLEGVNTGVVDLLTLTGGESELLAEVKLPPGNLTGMRLILGNDNTVVIDGDPYQLDTPSGQQSGLKLQVDHQLVAGEEYNFFLDFNVEESIVEAGESGNYILKPVIRLFAENETGSISGTVSPAEVQALITASNETITVSTYSNAEGKYMLRGLPAGTYEVTIAPDASLGGLPSSTFNNVSVEMSQTTELNPVTWDVE